jgi:hypothetical protein
MVLEYVRQKLPGNISHLGSLVCSIMFRKNMSYALIKGLSIPLTVEEIYKEVKANQINFKKDNIKEALELMSRDEYDIVTKNDSLDDQYTLHVDIIVNSIKSKTMEKIVEQEFSQHHCRIYRLLSKCGALDSKNVIKLLTLDNGNQPLLPKGLCYLP